MSAIQPMGLFSGQGGDLIAQEMMRRQQASSSADQGMQNFVKDIPQMMQQMALSKYYGGLQQNQEAQAKAKMYELSARDKAAKELDTLYPGKGIGSSVSAGLLEKESLADTLKAAGAEQGLTEVIGQWAGDNPNLAGKSQDKGFLKSVVAASGNDPEKAKAILDNTEKQYEIGIVEKNSGLFEGLMKKVEDKLTDPKTLNILQAGGIPKDAIPSHIILDILQNDKELAKDPEAKRVLLKHFAKGGPQGLETWASDVQKQIFDMQKDQAALSKTKAETVKAKAQATQADSTAALNVEKVNTEGTKQWKNMHPGAGKTGSSDKKAKEAERKATAMDKEIRKIEDDIAKEKGKPERKRNKPLIQSKQRHLESLQTQRGITPTKPQSFFGSDKGKKYQKLFGL